MKKYLKKILFILLIFSIFLVFNNTSFAVDETTKQYDFDAAWINKGDSSVVKPTKNIVDNIVKIIRTVGTGISIIMISYIGIKYMTGSPSEKADYKKSVIPFVTGAVILFATTNLVGIIYKFSGVITK